MRDAAKLYRRMTGRRHEKDKAAIAFPRGLEYLWRWFKEIEGGRPMADGFLLPIPATEYVAWATLAGVTLRPWEVMVLRAIDAAALKVAMEK